MQSFSAALFSALEKKDGEELSVLRTVHEQNLLKMRSRIEEWEIEAALDTLASLERQRLAVEYRRDYYQARVQNPLNDWELLEQASRHTASALHVTQAALAILSGTFHLLPEIGSPFAMKYGGKETGDSASRFSVAVGAMADAAEVISASAGLEATFERRIGEWQHQQTLAEKELLSIDKQIEAAKIRIDIATQSRDIHDRSIQQAEEVFEFYRDKFTNLGLYTFLSTRMHRVYRDAYNAAYATAKMAEQAYHFERPDDTASVLDGSYWDTSHAGLLAGEKLLLDLQNLERHYLETNYRTLEVEQAFSLAQFDPSALVRLQETGSCRFNVPEVFFDLTYPGHFRRRIKAARLTVPCVTGQYVNVGATLRLISSEVRLEPDPTLPLQQVPLRHTTTVATSSADNDAGVFEFTFRDERFMPFEGAGAISVWELSLPENLRPFEYHTIADVILRIAYTAESDEALRSKVEQAQGTLAQYLSTAGITRVFSLRHDFSDAWHKLVRSPLGTGVDITLNERHLPFFISNQTLAAGDIAILLKKPTALTDPQLNFDGSSLQSFPVESATGLPAQTVSGVQVLGKHILKVDTSGGIGPGIGTPPPIIDETKLSDILLRVTFRIAG